jgi:adenylylsulfate kinase
MKKISCPSPMTIWIYGLSASGKSTLGKMLFNWLLERGHSNVELLDGEFLRSKLDRKYGYSIDEIIAYEQNIAQIALHANIVRMNHAIVCSMTHMKKMREFAREIIGNLVEVYLDCDVETCRNREFKARYARALVGEYKFLPGVTDPFEIPANPDLVINTSKLQLDASSRILLEYCQNIFIPNLD